jgi:uncharacterized protein YebE (UPF0316 family)
MALPKGPFIFRIFLSLAVHIKRKRCWGMKELDIILIIVAINITYVSLFTLRIIMVMKSQLALASFLSMLEVFVYLMGLKIVLDQMDKPLNIAAYCIGWGFGVWTGSKIEEKLALGYITLQAVVDSDRQELPLNLRKLGFGVTHWLADGKDGPRLVMQVLAKRSHEKRLLGALTELAPKAFIISYEPKYFRGGFWTKRLK